MWYDLNGTLYDHLPLEEPTYYEVPERIHLYSQPSPFDEIMNNLQKRRESEARTERYKAEAELFKARAETERRTRPPGWI
jgi:hypothetical protein